MDRSNGGDRRGPAPRARGSYVDATPDVAVATAHTRDRDDGPSVGAWSAGGDDDDDGLDILRQRAANGDASMGAPYDVAATPMAAPVDVRGAVFTERLVSEHTERLVSEHTERRVVVQDSESWATAPSHSAQPPHVDGDGADQGQGGNGGNGDDDGDDDDDDDDDEAELRAVLQTAIAKRNAVHARMMHDLQRLRQQQSLDGVLL